MKRLLIVLAIIEIFTGLFLGAQTRDPIMMFCGLLLGGFTLVITHIEYR